MGARAIYNVSFMSKTESFYSHWGANVLTPFYRLSNVLEEQKTHNDKSIFEIFEKLTCDGKYAETIETNKATPYYMFEKLENVEDYNFTNDDYDIDMKIAINLDLKKIRISHNQNIPSFKYVPTISMDIDKGLEYLELTLENEENSSFDEMCKKFGVISGLDNYYNTASKFRELTKGNENSDNSELMKQFPLLFSNDDVEKESLHHEQEQDFDELEM